MSGLWLPAASGTQVSECTAQRRQRSVRLCSGITELSPVWRGEILVLNTLSLSFLLLSPGLSVTTRVTATSWAGARTAPCFSGTGTPVARPSWGRERWVFPTNINFVPACSALLCLLTLKCITLRSLFLFKNWIFHWITIYPPLACQHECYDNDDDCDTQVPTPRAILTGHEHTITCAVISAELGMVISGAR